MQDDSRPVPLSHCEMASVNDRDTLTLGGFGQPTIGPYAELHTPDQGVRLLAHSNLKMRGDDVFSCHIPEWLPLWYVRFGGI